jgi:hypothetical protein
MSYYLRYLTNGETAEFESATAAIAEAQARIKNQVAFPERFVSREDHRVMVRKDGQLIDGFWIEDEQGKPVNIP